MLDIQSDFIFPVRSVPEPGPVPRNAELLSMTTPDGTRLHGILIPAEVADPERVLILGFGGNAWNAQDVAEYLHDLYPGHDVVAFHYRGYPPSTGSPSGPALIADAPLVYDTAVTRVSPKRVVGVGFSIGSGVAAALAGQRKLAGLILVTPFDSLKAVAQSMLPWLPIGSLFSHEINAAAVLRDVDVPVAIIAAARDEIIPSERTDALRKQVTNLVFDRTIGQSGHNDIYARSDFHDAMHEALTCLEA